MRGPRGRAGYSGIRENFRVLIPGKNLIADLDFFNRAVAIYSRGLIQSGERYILIPISGPSTSCLAGGSTRARWGSQDLLLWSFTAGLNIRLIADEVAKGESERRRQQAVESNQYHALLPRRLPIPELFPRISSPGVAEERMTNTDIIMSAEPRMARADETESDQELGRRRVESRRHRRHYMETAAAITH